MTRAGTPCRGGGRRASAPIRTATASCGPRGSTSRRCAPGDRRGGTSPATHARSSCGPAPSADDSRADLSLPLAPRRAAAIRSPATSGDRGDRMGSRGRARLGMLHAGRLSAAPPGRRQRGVAPHPGQHRAVRPGGITAGSLQAPQGIAVDQRGSVWIANHVGNTVTVYPGGDAGQAGVVTGSDLWVASLVDQTINRISPAGRLKGASRSTGTTTSGSPAPPARSSPGSAAGGWRAARRARGPAT